MCCTLCVIVTQVLFPPATMLDVVSDLATAEMEGEKRRISSFSSIDCNASARESSSSLVSPDRRPSCIALGLEKHEHSKKFIEIDVRPTFV